MLLYSRVVGKENIVDRRAVLRLVNNLRSYQGLSRGAS